MILFETKKGDITDRLKEKRYDEELKKIIDEFVEEVKTLEDDEKTEKISKHEREDKDALELGVEPDNYYSCPKDKEEIENERTRFIEGDSGSFGNFQK